MDRFRNREVNNFINQEVREKNEINDELLVLVFLCSVGRVRTGHDRTPSRHAGGGSGSDGESGVGQAATGEVAASSGVGES